MNFDNSSILKKQLTDIYKYKIELHAHTSPVSVCADFTPGETLEKYAKLGYNAVVITNHFTYKYSLERFKTKPTAEEFTNWFLTDFKNAVDAGKKLGITVILGAEIRFSENQNDYLLYGVDKNALLEIFERLDNGIENLRKDGTLKNILVIQAHRFRNGMEDIDVSLLDGIETFNMHQGHNSRIGTALKFAKDNGIKITTAGSDFHHENGEGMAALRTKTIPKDSFELADILRSGDYIFELGQNSIVLP